MYSNPLDCREGTAPVPDLGSLAMQRAPLAHVCPSLHICSVPLHDPRHHFVGNGSADASRASSRLAQSIRVELVNDGPTSCGFSASVLEAGKGRGWCLQRLEGMKPTLPPFESQV